MYDCRPIYNLDRSEGRTVSTYCLKLIQVDSYLPFWAIPINGIPITLIISIQDLRGGILGVVSCASKSSSNDVYFRTAGP